MKAVLMSIQPKWCELIANGKKTVEVRKTRPKIETPFKVYIYCTKSKKEYLRKYPFSLSTTFLQITDDSWKSLNGKVIGEFVCDTIDEYTNYSLDEQHGHIKRREDLLRSACMTLKDWRDYIGSYRSDWGCAWHISNLIIYDKPKELSEFYKYTEYDDSNNDIRPCRFCEHNKFDWSENCEYCDIDFGGEHCFHLQLKRPPQSWCYVEEMR